MMTYEEFYKRVENSAEESLSIYGEEAAREFIKSEEIEIEGAYKDAVKRYEEGEENAFLQEIPSVSYCLYMCY